MLYHHLIKLLDQRIPKGRLIHIASAHGKVASPNKAAYVAAKHGLVGMSKVLALEAAEKVPGVTSNCICPGWVLTPLVQKQIATRAAVSGKSIDEEKVHVLTSQRLCRSDFWDDVERAFLQRLALSVISCLFIRYCLWREASKPAVYDTSTNRTGSCVFVQRCCK